jgi:hypothetical protein
MTIMPPEWNTAHPINQSKNLMTLKRPLPIITIQPTVITVDIAMALTCSGWVNKLFVALT